MAGLPAVSTDCLECLVNETINSEYQYKHRPPPRTGPCEECGVAKSVLWRCDIRNRHITLCNACGIRQRRKANGRGYIHMSYRKPIEHSDSEYEINVKHPISDNTAFENLINVALEEYNLLHPVC